MKSPWKTGLLALAAGLALLACEAQQGSDTNNAANNAAANNGAANNGAANNGDGNNANNGDENNGDENNGAANNGDDNNANNGAANNGEQPDMGAGAEQADMAEPGPWVDQEISYGADNLPGTFSAPEGARGLPAVLLLHQLNSTRAEWTTFEVLPALHEQGAVTLAVDLRGHGATSPAGGTSHREFSASDWAKLPQDAADALAWLRARPEVDPEKISIVGGSIGANTALLTFSSDTRLRAGAFLSPGLPDYRGLNIEHAMENAQGRPALVVGSRGDSNRAQDAEALAAQNEAAQAIVLDGGAHGARQLGQDAEARRRVVHLLATGQAAP